MKSPGKLRRSEFATEESPSLLTVKLLDETLTTELPETMVNSSPSFSPMTTRLGLTVVMVDWSTRGERAMTLGITRGVTTGVTTLRIDTTGATGICRAASVSTVTAGAIETKGLTIARTDTSGASGGSGAPSGGVAGATEGGGTLVGAVAGAGAALGRADCSAGTAGGCVVSRAACCKGVP